MTDTYRLVELHESAADFHARSVPDPPVTEIWWNTVTSPALVLGSSQRSDGLVDVEACADAGIDVVRRRSGGGAVLLTPGEVDWIDVIVPTGAPGWTVDVHATMVWLGEQLAAVVADALTGVAHPGHVAVNRSGMVGSEWSSLVCFEGLGPGEVLLGGQKLIGISQRRTRTAARLQCSWYRHYEPDRIASCFAADARPRPGVLGMVATLPAAVSGSIPERLRRHLDTSFGSNGPNWAQNGG